MEFNEEISMQRGNKVKLCKQGTIVSIDNTNDIASTNLWSHRT